MGRLLVQGRTCVIYAFACSFDRKSSPRWCADEFKRPASASLFGECWDRKGERRSFAWLRFNGNPPTMTIGDRLTDSEFYSRPWIFNLVRKPLERLEDRLREFFFEANAIIDDREAYCFLAHGSGCDVYLRRLTWFAVLDRIGNDILQ